MKTTVFLVLASLTTAQLNGFDWDAIDAAGPPIVETVPAGVVEATTADYIPATAAASVASVVKESPLTTDSANIATATPTPSGSARRRGLHHRLSGEQNIRRDACDPQPLGSGPTADPDTAQGFLDFPAFHSAANGASTPDGYELSFQNLNGSVEANGKIMGWSTLGSYDVPTCAGNCNSVDGCRAFNIYFERDPSVDPGPGCTNPASTTVIKCILWGNAVSSSLATNTGQWRGSDFQVVIAGSNGYTKYGFPLPAGYVAPADLGTAAIQAPLDCSGYDTYLGVRIFTDVPFDPDLCAAACTAQSEYNRAHPPINADGSAGYVQTCQFFDTYMLLKNGKPQFQECALYSMSWSASYATNTGQWRGSDQYTIDQSYSFTNNTDPGTSRYPCGSSGQR